MKRYSKLLMAVVLVVAVLTTLPSTVFAIGGFASDDFSTCAPVVNWTFHNTAVTGQSISESNNQLVIVAPPGTDQTIWKLDDTTLLYNVPRAMQSFGGTGTEDFAVEAKFDSSVTQQFAQQGIVIEKDPGNVLRFEFFYENATGVVIYAARFITNGSGNVAKLDMARVGGIATNPTALTMRVSRTANVWKLEYKVDAGAFTEVVLDPLRPIPTDYVITQIGVYAGTTAPGAPGVTAPGQTALVDYFFNVDSPIANEDVCVEPTTTTPVTPTEPTVTTTPPTPTPTVTATVPVPTATPPTEQPALNFKLSLPLVSRQ